MMQNSMMQASKGRASAVLLLAGLLMCRAELRAQDGSFAASGAELHYRSLGRGAPIVFLSGSHQAGDRSREGRARQCSSPAPRLLLRPAEGF
jgi:hypothetical protein